MRRLKLALYAVGFSLIGCVYAIGEEPAPGVKGMDHASLAAYPGAVISLKDPRTGMTFYVESNGRRLVGLTGDGRVAWSVDAFAAARIKSGGSLPVIRGLRVDGDALCVTLGKSDTVKVQIASGKAQYVGAD